MPTGNFGDILAGYYAKRMGLPIERLIVATNENDILARALATGRYEPQRRQGDAVAFDGHPGLLQFRAPAVRGLGPGPGSRPGADGRFRPRTGRSRFPRTVLKRIRADFSAERIDETDCAPEMGRVYRESGLVLDPHSAIGVGAARRALAASPTIRSSLLGTAHPAKFPDAVERATGVRPPLPAHLADLMRRKETIVGLPNDRNAVADYLRETARALA